MDIERIGDSSSAQRDVLIYVPGLNLTNPGKRKFDKVSQRIVNAYDRDDVTPGATFARRLRTITTSIGSVQVATVVKKTDVETDVADVYEFPWSEDLVAQYEKQGTRSRAFQGTVSYFYGVKLAVRLIRNSGFNWRRLFQAAAAVVGLLVVLAYLLTVIAAAIAAAFQLAESDPRIEWIQQLSIFLTSALVLFFPSLANRVPTVGAGLLAVSDYVRFAEARNRVTGRLLQLIDEIQQQNGVSGLHLIGYSMGSIVAYDTIYPSTGQVRSLEGVKSLTTIGPLYDVVQATRANYFESRSQDRTSPTWLSVWSPSDILSSERPHAPSGDTVAGTEPGNFEILAYSLGVDLTFLNMLVLIGFRSHNRYWGDDDEPDLNVFDQIIPRLSAMDP